MTTTELFNTLKEIKTTIATLEIGEWVNGTTDRLSDFWVERFEDGYEVSLVTETLYAASITDAASLSLDAYLNW